MVAQAAIVVAVLALVSLPVQSTNEQQASTSSAAAGPLAFTSGVSPQGLQLNMRLNATSIPSHGALGAQIEVVNTLNHNVSVSMPSYNQNIAGLGQTMGSLNWFDYTCGENPSGFLADFALFQGHITAANLSSSGTPLSLNTHYVLLCPASYPGQGQDTFLPKSDQVIAAHDLVNQTIPYAASVNPTTFYCTGPELAENSGRYCGNTTGLVGYWNASAPIQDGLLGLNSSALVYFPPGEYTIVACDAFNQYLYATFVVEPTSQTTRFASEVAPNGLQLELTLNATTMPSGKAITGQVAVANTSDQNVTVSTLGRAQNVTVWSNYINVCPSDYFMGYAVFAGHLTAGNISSAGTPLLLVPQMSLICPGPSGPSTITFLPNGGQATDRVVDPDEPFSLVLDQLNMTTVFCNTTEYSNSSFSCDWADPGLSGYWNYSVPTPGNYGFTSPAFARFPAGDYTIVAWDDWNQYAYATFVVQPVDVLALPP